MNLCETRGKQGASINYVTDKRATATKRRCPVHAIESTVSATQSAPIKQVTPLETDQVNTPVVVKKKLTVLSNKCF